MHHVSIYSQTQLSLLVAGCAKSPEEGEEIYNREGTRKLLVVQVLSRIILLPR